MKTKQVMLLLCAVIVWGSLGAPAHADVLATDYNKVKDAEWFKTYLTGVGVGFSWANVDLNGRGQARLYCPPEHLAVTADTYADILRREMTEHATEHLQASPVEFLLLIGLQRTFPCTKQGKGGKP